MLEFLPLNQSDFKRYSTFYSLCPEHCGEYSFFALWGWNETDSIRLAYYSDLCWIESKGNRNGLFTPIGAWDRCDWTTLLPEVLGTSFTLSNVPEAFLAYLPAHYRQNLILEELRDEWEYVHSTAELIELKGNKFSQKRAYVKAFINNYNWEYVPLLPEDFADLLAFQKKWRKRRESNPKHNPALQAEEQALERALLAWDDLPLLGALLKVDGVTVAYTIAEELDSETLDIRFEKAFSEYAGIYQALNKFFLERQAQNYRWVNREEDLGNPGLRDAKLSYHPVRFIKKFKIFHH